MTKAAFMILVKLNFFQTHLIEVKSSFVQVIDYYWVGYNSQDQFDVYIN